MKKTSSERRLWIEFAALMGSSVALMLYMNAHFSRYKPVDASQRKASPEEKARAEPVRRALNQATAQIDSPEKADQAVEKLERLAGSATTGDVEQANQPEPPQSAPQKVAESSRRIEQAANTGSQPEDQAANGIAQLAKEVAASPGRERVAISEATQETLNPEVQGQPAPPHAQERKLLQQSIIKRMKPLDALDAQLFLAINRLPHPQWLNVFFYSITLIFTGGFTWYLIVMLAILFNRRHGLHAARDTFLPLTVATALVEFPIKTYFRRRRPFIELIQAIVIGHKPGSWSFPSGHSASAFAGAWLFSRDYPERRPESYLLAGLVAFSRVYLGDHYPGDVLSGALFGTVIAAISQRITRVVLRLTGSDI